jgi:hypothetical protein
MQKFDLLKNLSLESFIKEILDENFISKENHAKYFWQSYISEHPFFEEIFKGEYAVDFIKLYLKWESNINTILLEKFVSSNPNATITSFRLTRAFLNEAQFQSISFFAANPNKLLQLYYKAFDVLRKREKVLFAIASKKDGVNKLNIIELLLIIFFHYEFKKREKKLKNEMILEHSVDDYILIQTYNYILSYSCCQKEEIISNEITTAEIIRTWRELMENDIINHINIYFDSINKWFVWNEFVHNQLDTYSYDFNYSVKEVAGGIEFYPIDPIEKAQRHASSIAGNMSYSKWDEKAVELAPKLFEEWIKSNPSLFDKRIPKFNELTHYNNFFFNISKSLIFSYFYGLDAVDEGKLIALVSAVSNAMAESEATYGKQICSIDKSNDFEWLIELIKITLSGDIEKLPIRVFPFEKWVSKYFPNFDTVNGRNNEIPIMFNLNHSQKRFNRFDPLINLWQTPFFKIGNTVCHIKTLLSDMDPAIVALESILNGPKKERTEVQKKETDRQEKRFADIFKDYGFVNVFGSYILIDNNKQTIGEYDLIFYDQNEILIFEIKRSRLQLTPEEQWKEQYEVVDHAANQLQKIITHIKSNPDCLLQPCNLDTGRVRASNISGCVITMYHHLDGTILAESIYKTSFVSLFNILKQCKLSTGNKVKAFINLASKPFLDPKEINLKPGQYNFVISEN